MLANAHNNFRCWEVSIFMLPVGFFVLFFHHLASTGIWGGLYFVLVILLQYLRQSRNQLCYQHLADTHAQKYLNVPKQVIFCISILEFIFCLHVFTNRVLLPSCCGQKIVSARSKKQRLFSQYCRGQLWKLKKNMQNLIIRRPLKTNVKVS